MLNLFKGKKIDFLILGAQKSGTTALFDFMTQHPNILKNSTKEIHYFDLNYNKGVNWYYNQFPINLLGKKKGEASPYYLYHPLVPARIKKELFYPVKFIVILRNPIDRALSHYFMNVNAGMENRTFSEAIKEEKERIFDERNKLMNTNVMKNYFHQHFSYLDRGRYFFQLKNWFLHFEKKNFLILEHNDFLKHPIENLEKVFCFLELISDNNTLNSIKLGTIHKGKYVKNKKYMQYRREIIDEFFEDNKKLNNLIQEDYGWR